MERKIGETFKTKKGITLQVVAEFDGTCIGCFYNKIGSCECAEIKELGHCSGLNRIDETSIIFRQIEANE